MRQPTPDGTHVFLIVWKTYRALLARAERSMKQLGLGDSDFRVLEALLHKGPLPVSVIGEKVGLTTGSITSAVDRMEVRRLVLRKANPDDRRLRVVELTARGRKLIEQAFATHQGDMEAAAAALSGPERVALVELLKKLGKAAAEG